MNHYITINKVPKNTTGPCAKFKYYLDVPQYRYFANNKKTLLKLLKKILNK